MKDAPKKKEEFETTKAFRARQNAWPAQFEKSYLIEKFGTPYLVVDAGKLETAYDADKGVLKVGSRLSSALPGILSVDEEYFSRELGSLNYRRLDFRIANSERYVASTAFGVKAEVTKESVTILGISLGVADGTHLWPPPPGKYPFNKPGVLKVRLSPAAAREWSKGVYLLVVGRLAPPFALITFHAHTPTLSEPLDQTGDINVIVVHPLCAVVFSKEPRRLLKEVPLH